MDVQICFPATQGEVSGMTFEVGDLADPRSRGNSLAVGVQVTFIPFKSIRLKSLLSHIDTLNFQKVC